VHFNNFTFQDIFAKFAENIIIHKKIHIINMSNTAILELDGKKYEFPVIVGSENEVAIDIEKLRAATGAITIDPGYSKIKSIKH
jgi:hypothetical protein